MVKRVSQQNRNGDLSCGKNGREKLVTCVQTANGNSAGECTGKGEHVKQKGRKERRHRHAEEENGWNGKKLRLELRLSKKAK